MADDCYFVQLYLFRYMQVLSQFRPVDPTIEHWNFSIGESTRKFVGLGRNVYFGSNIKALVLYFCKDNYSMRIIYSYGVVILLVIHFRSITSQGLHHY